MTPRLIALADTPPQPWRNGGGVTRELLAWPDGGDWRVRISVAEIEADGPFSAFPGVERWFAVLEGGGVALTIAGTEHRCRAGDAPLSFAGEASVELPSAARPEPRPEPDAARHAGSDAAGRRRRSLGAARPPLRPLRAGRRPLPRRRDDDRRSGRQPGLVRARRRPR